MPASLIRRTCSGKACALSAAVPHLSPLSALPSISGRYGSQVCRLSSRPQPSQHTRKAVLVAAASQDPARSLKETAALDELIDKLLKARDQQELARLVAENIFTIDAKFWLRVATRNDSAATSEEKARLKGMADTVLILVNTVLRKTEQQLSDSSKLLQEILKSAADAKGEWYLPLTASQVQSIRAALDRNSDRLDEALLSNAFAWIRKCSEDGFDTMVALIQKVLQLYAAKQLQAPEAVGVDADVNKVVYAEEVEWAGLIRQLAESGSITEPAFMEALQKRMESTVLGLQSGSYAQRVQAEYLKEVEARARSVFKELAQSGKPSS
ncbi:hypothetical protein QJQ45_013720 [Haematococcus lacustris]|nr:hypothetical protein QJQ45_013720 [Haematococcus lacustris]